MAKKSSSNQEPTILRGHHIEIIQGVRTNSIEELIRGFKELGYKNAEEISPTIEKLRDLIRNSGAKVRFEVGCKDFICDSCGGSDRCVDDSKNNGPMIDEAYLKRAKLKPGKDYTIKKVLEKIDKRIAEYRYL